MSSGNVTRISEHVWAMPLYFQRPGASGPARLVHAYLVAGAREAALVDCGTSTCQEQVEAGLAEAGHIPERVPWLIATHEHADHMGAARPLVERYGMRVVAHQAACRWLEDAALQARERPMPHFDLLMAGSVRVDRRVEDGDTMDLGGCTLRMLYTPGHSAGSMSLLVDPDGVAITGDALISAVGAPFYDDPAAVIASVERLRAVASDGARLLASHAASPSTVGPDALDETVALVERLAQGTRQALAELGDGDEDAFVRRALDLGGWPSQPVMPVTRITVRAHRASA
jgi:hydroxyacylglutathione hydrolase